jgi:4-hydroxy-3-methylbut-2-en-1-yl diphosphate reductase
MTPFPGLSGSFHDARAEKVVPWGMAFVPQEVRYAGVTRKCLARPLLTGSLVRADIDVTDTPLTELDPVGPVSVFAAPVPGSDELLLAAGGCIGDGVLEAAQSAVAEWKAVAAERTVLLASPRSFCAGVERAIEIVELALKQHAGQVYVRKQIVHNSHVIKELTGKGAIFVDKLDDIPDGAVVVFSAHGVSPAVREEAAERGMKIIDGTCPLVTKVHVEARRYAARGDTIILIGHSGHEEVDGTLGEAPNAIKLVETAADVEHLSISHPGQLSYLTQTTLAVDETAEIVDALRQRFPVLHEPPTDDICYATTNRQNAVRAVIGDADLVLVLGSSNSSNSVRLAELSRREGTPAFLVEHAGEIRPEWLEGVHTVGLTAGASAPPVLVDDVISALRGLGKVTVEERETARETVHFGLPANVRSAR